MFVGNALSRFKCRNQWCSLLQIIFSSQPSTQSRYHIEQEIKHSRRRMGSGWHSRSNVSVPLLLMTVCGRCARCQENLCETPCHKLIYKYLERLERWEVYHKTTSSHLDYIFCACHLRSNKIIQLTNTSEPPVLNLFLEQLNSSYNLSWSPISSHEVNLYDFPLCAPGGFGSKWRQCAWSKWQNILQTCPQGSWNVGARL